MISLSCPQDGYTLRDAEKPETALERAILGALLMHPELTRSALARQVRGRRKDVYAAINNLVARPDRRDQHAGEGDSHVHPELKTDAQLRSARRSSCRERERVIRSTNERDHGRTNRPGTCLRAYGRVGSTPTGILANPAGTAEANHAAARRLARQMASRTGHFVSVSKLVGWSWIVVDTVRPELTGRKRPQSAGKATSDHRNAAKPRRADTSPGAVAAAHGRLRRSDGTSRPWPGFPVRARFGLARGALGPWRAWIRRGGRGGRGGSGTPRGGAWRWCARKIHSSAGYATWRGVALTLYFRPPRGVSGRFFGESGRIPPLRPTLACRLPSGRRDPETVSDRPLRTHPPVPGG